MDLNKEEHKTEKAPLVEGCKCYTCKNYTRAYIYHMLEVKEMNANILLAIHNVAMYDRFFEIIRGHVGPRFGPFVEAYLAQNCI